MNNNKTATVLSIVALVVAVIVGFIVIKNRPAVLKDFVGAAGNMLAENYIPYVMYNGGFNTAKDINTTASLTVGPNGGAVNEMKSTTCTLTTTVTGTALGTTTKPFNCTVTGVASGDQVFVTLANNGGIIGQAAALGGIRVDYAIASTSAGNIEVGLSNWSGTATSSYPMASTSAQVLYFDN